MPMAVTMFQLVQILHKHLYTQSPVDTGNLHDRGLAMQQFSPTSAGVVLGGLLAPYGPITTLPWVAARWNGKRNPNEGWAFRASESAADEMAALMGGVVR